MAGVWDGQYHCITLANYYLLQMADRPRISRLLFLNPSVPTLQLGCLSCLFRLLPRLLLHLYCSKISPQAIPSIRSATLYLSICLESRPRDSIPAEGLEALIAVLEVASWNQQGEKTYTRYSAVH